MRPIPKAKSLAIGAAFLVGLGLGSCLDDTSAPGAVLPGRFAVAPAFISVSAGIIEIAQVRIILTRPDDNSVALDTVVAVEPGTEELDLTLTVPVLSSSEVFLMTVEFITPAGEVAFRGGPVEVTATTDPTAPPVQVEVAAEYVGVGADAVEVRIICPAAPAAGASAGLASSVVCPTNPTLSFGGTLDLTAEALGPDGTQRPGAPIAWSALEPVRAAVADPRVGQVSGGSERGPARIVAELLTGPADTIQLIVQPVPSSLGVVSGDGQTGSTNLQLPSPVVVEVTAADALPVEGVTVDFQTPDGGSFSATSAVTDAAGRAQTNWTLGPTLGTQNATATVSGFPTLQATITAEAIPSEIFGAAHIGSGAPSTLYSIDPVTGTATAIGPIGFNRVGAMDFHPVTGVLYATGQRPSEETQIPVLITIDPGTGTGTEVGPTGISGSIAGVSFRSDGMLFVYDATGADHTLNTANLSTGAATLVGSTGLSANSGNGISFDSGDILFHSNRDDSHTLSQTTGAATPLASMNFQDSCLDIASFARIAAADLDPATGVFFAVVKCASGGSSVFLGTVDYATGTVSIIGPTVDGLDALAVR